MNLPVYMMCSVGIFANLMLLIAVVKDPLKCFRNSAAYLVGNLALSDMSYNGLFMVNISLSSKHGIAYPLLNILFYSSMAMIFSIALDRFLMIRYPFKHRILMSENKMVVWIAIVWFLSCIHPLKMIFVLDKFDETLKLWTGVLLIMLTGVTYSGTYFTLRKQSSSMFGMKAKFPSTRRGNAANKTDRENQVATTGDANEHSTQSEERAQSQDERAKSDGERAQNQDQRAQSRNERVASRSDRCRSHDQHAKSESDRTQIPRDIQCSPRTNVTHNLSSIRKEISARNSSSKTHTKPQPVNNAKEQRFLNTIIIIACFAVVTILVGTVLAQLLETVLKERSVMKRILKSLCFTIYCLNFVVNPFIYCFRLKQYRKTFQMVYGCRC